MKLDKLLWAMYIFMLAAKLITDKFCKILVFQSIADFGFLTVAIALCIYSVSSLIKTHNENKYNKAYNWWLTQHMSILPESNEILLTVEDQLEEYEETIISEIKEKASKIGYKVTIKSPISKVIDQYYS